MNFPFQFTFSNRVSSTSKAQAQQALLHMQQEIRVATDDNKNPFFCFSIQNSVIDDAQKLLDTVGIQKVKYVIQVGIGGMNLASKALYSALAGKFGYLENESVKLLSLDTLDVQSLMTLTHIFESSHSDEEFLCIIASESGKTLETIANFETLLASFTARFPQANRRCIVLGQESSPLIAVAVNRNIRTGIIPSGVGGRFSAFTVAQILPMLALRLPVVEYLQGARTMLEHIFLHEDSVKYLALQIQLYTKKYRVHDSFIFNQSVEDVGKWYRQLLAESTARLVRQGDKDIVVGVMPTVTMGTVDLHSQAQLYFSGSAMVKRFTTFLYARQLPTQVRIDDTPVTDIIPMIAGRSYKELMNAVYQGVLDSYRECKLPFVAIELPRVDAASLGAYFAFQMVQVCALCTVLDVSPFGQDKVEIYKEKTREYLGKLKK